MRASLRERLERLSEGGKIKSKKIIVIDVYDLILVGDKLTLSWNELIILWNDLTIIRNELTWNEIIMERSDRTP